MNMKTWRDAVQENGLNSADDEWRIAEDEERNGPELG